MNIYVCSKWENKREVSAFMNDLVRGGHKITHDWTQESWDGLKGGELEDHMRYCAENDVAGVLKADVVVMLNYPGICGAATEFGMAIALKKKCIVVYGQHAPDNVFYHLSEVKHFRSTDAAVDYLNNCHG